LGYDWWITRWLEQWLVGQALNADGGSSPVGFETNSLVLIYSPDRSCLHS
jgi:hypothetical protein